VIALVSHPQGVLLPVRAQPGARRNAITGQHDGSLKVSVTQVAERGKANKALIALLSQQLGLRKSQLTLIAGETSSHKQLLVSDITAPELAERIERALAKPPS
jgi:hypothetical protein